MFKSFLGWSVVLAVSFSASHASAFELIRNGDFKQSGFYWKKTDFYTSFLNSQREAVSTFEVEDEAAKISVTRRGGDHWHAQLLQSGLVLEEGKSYRFSGRMKVTDKAPADRPVSLTFSFIQPGNQVKVHYENRLVIPSSDRWETFVFDFVSPVNDDFVRLDINFGKPSSGPLDAERFILWVDDISLQKKDNNDSPYKVEEGIGLRTPVKDYGALSVDGQGRLISAVTGQTVQLRGMSLHGIHWDRPWYFSNRDVLLELKEKWKADFIRIPIYLGQGGYIEDQSMLFTVHRIIEDAKALNMYAMIDWHVHNDNGNPNRYVNESRAFFRMMAEKYGNTPNIIWEIANEPNGNVDWYEIKKYADLVIPEIRAFSANPVIVGTPIWSQEVQTVLNAPLLFSDVLYAFHFYAATHRLDNFQAKIEAALAGGLGIFVTEWGTTTASGYGTPDLNESRKWMDYINSKNLSWANWSFSAEQEDAAALSKQIPDINPVPSQRGGWQDYDLSVSGRFVKEEMLRNR